jgi:hypothetical protein
MSPWEALLGDVRVKKVLFLCGKAKKTRKKTFVNKNYYAPSPIFFQFEVILRVK